MMETPGVFSMRSLLRAILIFALLFGSGVADLAPVQTVPHESCCCGSSAGAEDTCPCPKPEGNSAPSRGTCATRGVVATQALSRIVVAQRRREARPEPKIWVGSKAVSKINGYFSQTRERDPDLQRHLARLSTFRI
jgi:hypothetical protein